MDGIRARLTDERTQTSQRRSSLAGDFAAVVAASRDTNADDEHDPEGATIAFERSQLGSLIRQADRRLEEIDAALERLEAGTYGTCERCGAPIGEARLEARPTARLCMRCAAASRP